MLAFRDCPLLQEKQRSAPAHRRLSWERLLALDHVIDAQRNQVYRSYPPPMPPLPPNVRFESWLSTNKQGETDWTVLHLGKAVGRVSSRKVNYDAAGKPRPWELWWFGCSTLPGREGWLRWKTPPGKLVAEASSADAERCATRARAADMVVVYSLM